MARRVVAKVEFHCGELFPRVGFIVTNLGTSMRAAVRLQQARDSGTVDQRGQAGGRADAAFLSPLSRQRSAAVAEPDRLQPRELVATAGAAHADRKVVADQLAAAADENRRTIDPSGRVTTGFC